MSGFVVLLILENHTQNEVLNFAQCSPVPGKVLPGRKILTIADAVINRLEYLRRNATLEAKTGLFYLPVPQTESSLLDFFRMYPTLAVHI